MANLGGTFDASAVEPSVPMEILPPGKYQVQIVKSEMKDTKGGSGQMLALEMEILDGTAKGRKLWDNLNLVNSNATAQEIAQRALSAICHAVGKMQVSDSEELHFMPLIATVSVEPDKRDEHLPAGNPAKRMQNRVKGYSAAGGQTASFTGAPRPATVSAAPAAATSAPAAKPAPAPAAANAPWRRSA